MTRAPAPWWHDGAASYTGIYDGRGYFVMNVAGAELAARICNAINVAELPDLHTGQPGRSERLAKLIELAKHDQRVTVRWRNEHRSFDEPQCSCTVKERYSGHRVDCARSGL